MFSFSKAGQIEYLQSSILKECDFMIHAFCTRRGGVSRGDYKSLNMSFKEGDEDNHVLQNWRRLSEAFSIPLEQFLVVNQVHKDDIFIVKPYGGYFSSRAELDYDGIMTDRAALAICVKTADCVPVFIVDRVKKIIAVIHAGWRGSALGISAKAAHLFVDKYGSTPRDILAAIGPSIGQCCYQVDKAAADEFLQLPDHKLFLSAGKKAGLWTLSLAEANRRQLIDSGIPEKNIDVSDMCTLCNQDKFFSHRGSGGITGRQVNFMMIRQDDCYQAMSHEDQNTRH